MFFAYLPDIGKAFYMTNITQSLNSLIRAGIKKREVFSIDNSLRKVIYLAIKDASKKWSMPFKNWQLAISRFTTKVGYCLSNHF